MILRVTGFGQDGPYASRPGFATMAEAMSGFAAINGEPDGAAAAPADRAHRRGRRARRRVRGDGRAARTAIARGEGQVVDVNLLESMLQMMSALPSAAAHLDYDQPRLGSGIPYSVPRGTYRCADGHWVAISTSAESVAHRVLALLGVGDDARFATLRVARRAPRRARRASSRAWVGARPQAEVLAAFEAAEAAIAPVYTMRELLADPHVRARNVFVEVDGVTMTGPTAALVAHARARPSRGSTAGRQRRCNRLGTPRTEPHVAA